VSRFMPHPFELSANWNRDSSGLSGKGSFNYGPKRGDFALNKLKRHASTRSLELSFEATTNIPGFKKLTVKGNYSFNNEAVFNLDHHLGCFKDLITF